MKHGELFRLFSSYSTTRLLLPHLHEPFWLLACQGTDPINECFLMPITCAVPFKPMVTPSAATCHELNWSKHWQGISGVNWEWEITHACHMNLVLNAGWIPTHRVGHLQLQDALIHMEKSLSQTLCLFQLRHSQGLSHHRLSHRKDPSSEAVSYPKRQKICIEKG